MESRSFCIFFCGLQVQLLLLYFTVLFLRIFWSPKEKLLTQQIENIKLQYSLIGRELDNSIESLNSFRLSDDRRYRPILGMDSVPESYRKAGMEVLTGSAILQDI